MILDRFFTEFIFFNKYDGFVLFKTDEPKVESNELTNGAFFSGGEYDVDSEGNMKLWAIDAPISEDYNWTTIVYKRIGKYSNLNEMIRALKENK